MLCAGRAMMGGQRTAAPGMRSPPIRRQQPPGMRSPPTRAVEPGGHCAGDAERHRACGLPIAVRVAGAPAWTTASQQCRGFCCSFGGHAQEMKSKTEPWRPGGTAAPTGPPPGITRHSLLAEAAWAPGRQYPAGLQADGGRGRGGAAANPGRVRRRCHWKSGRNEGTCTVRSALDIWIHDGNFEPAAAAKPAVKPTTHHSPSRAVGAVLTAHVACLAPGVVGAPIIDHGPQGCQGTVGCAAGGLWVSNRGSR